MRSSIPIISTLLASLSFSTAAPLLQQRQNPPPTDTFLLQTVVTNSTGDTGTNKTGLYVVGYHTGAGFADATLTSNKSIAWEAYFNGSQLYAIYQDTATPDPYPAPLSFEFPDYQEWAPVTLNQAGAAEKGLGFFLNSTGIQYNVTDFGWVACDWWHGVPQLFALNGYPYGGPVAPGCSKVNLINVPVS